MAREVDILGMLEQNLARVLDLIRKTGDRVIVFAGDGQPYVLMNIDEYERLVTRSESVAGLTEVELLDKINRDIASWKAKEQDNNLEDERVEEPKRESPHFRGPWPEEEFDWDEAEEEDTYYFEKV